MSADVSRNNTGPFTATAPGARHSAYAALAAAGPVHRITLPPSKPEDENHGHHRYRP